MRSIARAAWAAALLNCALPQAWADDANHWLKDPYTQCRMFDANAKPGDHVGWLGDCDGGLASGEGTAIFMNGDRQFESFTGSFARGVALDGPVTVTWGDGWRYEGNQTGGQFSGTGVLVNPAKDRFNGSWTGGKMNGQGTLIRANGERYDGLWKDDLPNGEGTLTRADGSIVKGVFRDGKLDDASLDAVVKKDELKKAPEVHAFAGISGKTLTSVDGSRIALTLIDGGIERQITDMGAPPKKTTFAFMNDRLGTVVEDGGDAAGANVTGFFRLTDTGVEVRYADGRGEMLTATQDGGVLMQRSAVSGQISCRTWYPDGHAFSEADKKQALAEYASHLGLGPAPAASCNAAPGPQAMLQPSDTKAARGHAARVKQVSLIAPARLTAPTKIDALLPVTVKDSVVHTIDADSATPPVTMTRLPEPQIVLPDGQQDASACLKVESDGSHWNFHNACGYSVQFSYCMWHGSELLAACGADGEHAISGSVAAHGLAALTTDTSFSEKDGDHDFRWIACNGGAGEVVAHLDRAEPPSGRCERAAVAVNRH